ncbi:putative rho GTPase-activating protein 20 isoform X7 [Apostichopus japonicus]|uniref:Putative rho GTPase-activating protein 20 isoform X7 n=1 Tax=Stichopus japonicus TaxID=307972 RepID=A0A2G8LLW4_STIJA|nr:putative rho GTPase-activating protein 20 isoform X7 [Apostichopus japonicus]
MEGPVQITVGLQTQVRYLFLFNDVLIIAKPNKSCTLFRLKHRLRVCELWLANCIQDVSEINNAPEMSFVVGWPTTNNVLTFSSKEEKSLWWQSLSKHVEAEREKQDVKSASIRVCNRDEESKTMHNKTFQVEYNQTSKDVLALAMQNFSLPQDQVEGYQLWVQSGKEEDLYPLIGHEYPHSIKMNHTRDAALHREDMYFPGDIEQLSSTENELRGYQCQFILRRKGQSSTGISLDTAGIQRRLRKNKKSPFKLNFRRSLSGKVSSSSPSESQLFGKSLSVICPESEPPQPILDLLANIYNNGPFTHGIFRKSANARVTRELKAQLNAGEQCDLTDIHVSAAASMLMDFLRNLPDCIFTGQLYNQWVLVNQLTDPSEKINKVKSILSQLPEANVNLLRYIFCIFHHITLNSGENDMNHTNLAICTSPSMIWPPLSAGALAQAQSTKESPQLLQFLIKHCLEIFGAEMESLFGPAPVRKETVCALDSGGDSDGAFSRRNGSSMDSIEQEFGDDFEPNNNAHLKKWGGYGTPQPLVSPSSLSRDSGITSSDNQIYPDSDNTDTTDSGVNSQEKLNTILNSSANRRRFNQNEGYLTSEDVMLAPTRRARTGSDPSIVSPEVGRRLLMSGQTGGSGENISPETLKFIEDVSKESKSTLLLPAQSPRVLQEDLTPPSGYHPSSRFRTSALSPSSNSKSSSLEQMPQGSLTAADSKASHVYSRRVSAPSMPSTAEQSFPNRMSTTRQSASSVSSSSSGRLSDGQSSGSTEKLYHGQSHMLRADGAQKASDVVYYLPASEHSSKHTSNKTLSPRGSKASRSSSFMKALTPESRQVSHARAAKPHRPYQTSQGRHSDIPEATPPSEFFPKDAMRYSLPSQDIDKNMKTIEEYSENQESQRTAENGINPRMEATLPNSAPPPPYREAVNRRPQFKQSHSMDADHMVQEKSNSLSGGEPKRLSAPERVMPVERQRSKVKDRRQVVGIFIHDSESSDDEISDLENLRLQRSLSGSVTGHSKPRQVRRSSSDSKASARRVSSTSGDRSKQYMQTSQLFYGQDAVFQDQSTDRSTPTSSTSGSDRTVTSSEVNNRQRHGRRSPEKTLNQSNQSTVSSPRRTHPTSHDHSHQPGYPRDSRCGAKERVSPANGLRRSLDRDTLNEKVKAHWQSSRKGDSFDSGTAADEYANMDFDDESYV